MKFIITKIPFEIIDIKIVKTQSEIIDKKNPIYFV